MRLVGGLMSSDLLSCICEVVWGPAKRLGPRLIDRVAAIFGVHRAFLFSCCASSSSVACGLADLHPVANIGPDGDLTTG